MKETNRSELRKKIMTILYQISVYESNKINYDVNEVIKEVLEIENDFVKDVSRFAKLNDILYAKILDVDNNNKQIKLSIKATQPKVRYKSYNNKQKNNPSNNDFSQLESRLNYWIIEQLKEKNSND
jgi:predicted RNA-binding protein with RPS1 domain